MSERTKKVVLAYDYTDGDDKKHKADATVSLPVHEANNLLARGRARLPETDKSPSESGSAGTSKES